MASLARRASVYDVFNRMLEDSFVRPSSHDAEEVLLPVDVAQTERDVVVRASLPGFRKEDIELRIEKGVLSIRASRQAEQDVQEEKYYRRERFAGSLIRRVALPGMVQEHESTAELKDGVLTLRVPIAEAAKPKQIAIQ